MRRQKRQELAMKSVSDALKGAVEEHKLNMIETFGILETLRIHFLKNWVLSDVKDNFDENGNYVLSIKMDDLKANATWEGK